MVQRSAISGWSLLAAAFIAPLFAGSASAQDSLSADVLQKLKQAAVFVKVVVGPLNFSGSGFVVTADKDAVYLVTNEHVVAKPNLDFNASPLELRGRSRLELRRLQLLWGQLVPEVSVVFNSGAKEEQVLPATVLAVDPQRDLAILKVAGVRTPPQPIPLDLDFEPLETTPVFILGFPFGEALSLAKGNPAISVGRGAVSSLRRDEQGEGSSVQIDGALNPGNSGGPVVDAKGRLVGIAVATIKGAGIGFAIPPATLRKMLSGTIAQFTVKSRETDDAWHIDVSLKLIDPFQRLRKAAVHCISGDVKSDGTAPLADSQNVQLTIKDGVATGTWSMPKSGAKPSMVTLQPALTDADDKTMLLTATAHPVFGSEPVPSSAPSVGFRPPLIVPRRTVVALDNMKVGKGLTGEVGGQQLAGGMFVLDKKGPSFGFGLAQTGEAASRCTYFLVLRLPSGGFNQASFMAKNKTAQDRTTCSYGAFLDDESITVDHSFAAEQAPLAGEQFTLLDEKYDPASGRVFLIDARESPPRVTQKKIDLTRDYPTLPLDDGQILDLGRKTLEELQKAHEEVRKFLQEK
jgi:S1-C subfamily serine protease